MNTIQSIEGLNRTKKWKTGEFTLCLSWDIQFTLSLDTGTPVFTPLDSGWITPLALLVFLLADGKLWLSVSKTVWAHSIRNLSKIYPIGLSLWRTLLAHKGNHKKKKK